MPKYRKLPVEIEAEYLPDPAISKANAARFKEIAKWCGGRIVTDAVDGNMILVETLEGDMKALPGDWIVKGVAGEFRPVKDAIFAATYEAV